MYICNYISYNLVKTQITLNQLFHYILADAVKRRAVETEMKLLQTLLFATGKFFVKIFVCNYTENFVASEIYIKLSKCTIEKYPLFEDHLSNGYSRYVTIEINTTKSRFAFSLSVYVFHRHKYDKHFPLKGNTLGLVMFIV